MNMNERSMTFSQAQGYEELPAPLKLEELPAEARTHIWNVFYAFIDNTKAPFREIGGVWKNILLTKHIRYDNFSLDEWNDSFEHHRRTLRYSIEKLPFNQVFDLIQFVFRHAMCPPEFIDTMKHTFTHCRLAYTIDAEKPPTIIPAVTEAEGNSIIESLQLLRRGGLEGSAAHLRKVSEYINQNDWAGSIRESIHAVESVARQLDPEASKSLGPALASLEKQQSLHPALKEAFTKLYGYTSDEQGVRHALLDRSNAKVGRDEAVFMLGACASFASYLLRKHSSGDGP